MSWDAKKNRSSNFWVLLGYRPWKCSLQVSRQDPHRGESEDTLSRMRRRWRVKRLKASNFTMLLAPLVLPAQDGRGPRKLPMDLNPTDNCIYSGCIYMATRFLWTIVILIDLNFLCRFVYQVWQSMRYLIPSQLN